jgi:hypothetical protein
VHNRRNHDEAVHKRRKMVIDSWDFVKFCPLCNGISPILMYKYVVVFSVERSQSFEGLTCEKFLVIFG